jgi:glycogen debranching enzyme
LKATAPEPAALPAREGETAQFQIGAATSLQERRPRTLKHGDCFAVYDANGDIVSAPGSPDGLYFRDTRHLSRLHLSLNGARPLLLSSGLRDDNAALICDLTNPDFEGDNGEPILRHDHIHIRRVRILWDATAYERVVVRNFDDRPRRLTLSFAYGADFADVFEVRGDTRPHRGKDLPPVVGVDAVTFAYLGLDATRRETHLRFDPAPTTLTAERADFVLDLAAGETRILFMQAGCRAPVQEQAVRRSFFVAMRNARRALRVSSSAAASIATSNDTLNEAMRRSVSDLYMLITETPEGPYPYAGIPWFSTVFGRDGLIAALQTLWLDPNIALGVLRHLAANQAEDFDDFSDAEPGKILHELRRSEMAELGEVPFRRYYGSIDSTPLFVILAGAYLERTDEAEHVRALWPNIEAALLWMDKYGDRDSDGWIEYGRRSETGLANQGWKDSHDSIFHADGALARGSIALVEVQAYAYGAWRAAATIAARLGFMERAAQLDAHADALRRRFDAQFFDEELGTYVLALDGEKRPCRVRSSNAGHVLFTGLALPERAASVASSLMSGASFSGFGIRTIATTEARYNPMSYHNGSVWPHDTTLVAAGFARYGFRHEAARVFEALFAASTHMDLRRLPELFCGFPRRKGTGPVFYPVACSPQAWATGSMLYMMQICLGLKFEPRENVIRLHRPILPDFVDGVTLRRLRMGKNTLDLSLQRADHDVLVHVAARDGDCRVVTSL